jgi:branched-chain amino acid transport system permease protein
MSRRAWASAGIGGLFLLLPALGVDDYYLHLLIMAGLFFLLAAGMNLLLAAGQLNLGHTAFFGIGAYTSGLLALHFGLTPLLTMPLAALFTALVGVAVGRLTLKLRGAYFVLVTTGFAEVIRLVATNWMDLTQGPMGLAGVPPFDLGTVRWTLEAKRDYYYFMALLAAGTLYLTARLLGSRVGRALAAIRSNEGLAESSGISAYRHTMLAMVVACGLAGAAGAFYAHYITFLSPELFGFQNTVTMAVMVVAGGQGVVLGPAVGALVFTFIPELLRMAAFYRMLLYGVILLLVVMFMPKGLVHYFRLRAGEFFRFGLRFCLRLGASCFVRYRLRLRHCLFCRACRGFSLGLGLTSLENRIDYLLTLEVCRRLISSLQFM